MTEGYAHTIRWVYNQAPGDKTLHEKWIWAATYLSMLRHFDALEELLASLNEGEGHERHTA